MHAGSVLSLDNGPFPAHRLDGIEETVPDTDACKRKGTLELPLHSDVHILAYNQRDQRGDQSGHGKDLPVGLIDKHAKIFAQVDRDLRKAAAVSSCHKLEGGAAGRTIIGRNTGVCFIFHLVSTCLSAYLRTNSSERPSPPSSFWLIRRRIPSMEFCPKNSRASSILP